MARRGGRGVSRRGWALALLALAPTLLCCVSAAREPANVAVGDVAPAAVQSWTAAPQLPQANNARDGAPLQARGECLYAFSHANVNWPAVSQTFGRPASGRLRRTDCLCNVADAACNLATLPPAPPIARRLWRHAAAPVRV